MQVIPMLMGDQDEVDASPRGGIERRNNSDKWPDAGRKDRIGEHNSATELDPNRRMAKKPHITSIGSVKAERTPERQTPRQTS